MEVGGKIRIGGVETEFTLTDEGSFMQWGGTTEQLGPRVDLLEKLGGAYLEWRQENVCTSCGENLLDDGEGYDGRCGDCADRASCPADCSPDDDEMMTRRETDGPKGVCTECGTDWNSWNGEDYDDFREEQYDERKARTND